MRYHFIYKTSCKNTGQFYIGMHSTDDLNDGYRGSGRQVRRLVRIYAAKHILFEILEFCADRDELKRRERQIVDSDLLKNPLCLNLMVGGEGGSTRLGEKHTSETKERIRQALLGHRHSEDTKAKIAATSKGRGKGKPLSEEHRQKVAAAMRGRPSPLKGVPRPPEVAQAISEAVRKYNQKNPRSKKPTQPPVSSEEVSVRQAEVSTRMWANPEIRARILATKARQKAEYEAEQPDLTLYYDEQRHMVCVPFSIPNLRRAAKKVGIGRHFYHFNPRHPHVDVPKYRMTDIGEHAICVSPRTILSIIQGTFDPSTLSR